MLASMGIALAAWLAARTGQRAPLIIGSALIAILGMCNSLGCFSFRPNPQQATSSSSRQRHVRYLYGYELT